MAKKTFLLTQAQAFTAPILTVKWQKVDVAIQQQLINVTSSGDTLKKMEHGIPVEEIVATGAVWNGTGSTFTEASEMTMTTTPANIQPWDWVIGKRWGMLDVTGAGDTVKAWVHTYPSVYFSIRGWCLANGFDHTTKKANIVMSNSGVGEFDGNAIIASFPVECPIARGGWMGTTISGEFNNGVTYTKGNSNWDTTFLDTVTEPPRGTCSLSGTIDTISGTYYAYDVQIRGTRRVGGPLTAVVRFRKDEPDS